MGRLGEGAPLQKFAEFFIGQSGIANNSAHGECIYRIVSRNGQDSRAVGHYDVTALTKDTEAGFFKRGDGSQVIYSRHARQFRILPF
jgi:hypothetical protein